MPVHHRGIVRIGHLHELRMQLVGVADHAEQAFFLLFTVDDKVGVEDLVPAVFAVGLGEHHQFHVGWVALQLGESINQVIHLVVGQGQAKRLVGRSQSGPTTAQHIHLRHRRGLFLIKQLVGRCTLKHHAFGHAVVQQVGNLLQLRVWQTGLAQQGRFQYQGVFNQSFDAFDLQPAIARNVGGFGGPRRDRSKTRRDQYLHAITVAGIGRKGLAIREQIGQARLHGAVYGFICPHQVHKPGADLTNPAMDDLQFWQQLLNAKVAQGASAIQYEDGSGFVKRGGLGQDKGLKRV